jgi:uncharacterized protein (TIGR01777 family)
VKALVTGATGFIGRHLLPWLKWPAVLTRNPERAGTALANVEIHRWEPETGPPPAEAFRGVDTVFHLAGESVAAGRWSATRKQRIRDSRVLGTRHLVAALAALKERPAVLVSASAIGYYGDRGDEALDEDALPGNDFLAGVCKEWEAEANQAAELGIRVVTPRIGIVLGKGGGALEKMLTPFRLGLGGRLGSGRQWMSWIHIDDLIGLLLYAGPRHISGPMNAVAPNPVTNREFTRELAGALRRPAVFPVPEFALKLAFGEMAGVLLSSQRVVPAVAQRTGYRFQYPRLADALREITTEPRP